MLLQERLHHLTHEITSVQMYLDRLGHPTVAPAITLEQHKLERQTPSSLSHSSFHIPMLIVNGSEADTLVSTEEFWEDEENDWEGPRGQAMHTHTLNLRTSDDICESGSFESCGSFADFEGYCSSRQHSCSTPFYSNTSKFSYEDDVFFNST